MNRDFLKAIHVVPFFGRELEGGSQVYAYNVLTRLPRLNVEVTVATTQSATFKATSAFNLKWGERTLRRHEDTDGLCIRRFPVTFSVPDLLGKRLSRKILRRWEQEDERCNGHPANAMSRFQEYYRAAMERPFFYDAISKLLRGPYSVSLLSYLMREAPKHDVVVTGFVPFTLFVHAHRISDIFKKPLVVLPFFHPNDRYHYWRHFFLAMRRASAVIAQSRYTHEFVFPRFGIRSSFVGGGVDWEGLHSPTISGRRFRQRFGIAPSERLVLFVGRKESGKKYQTAVECVERVNFPQVKLLIVGKDIDSRPITSTRTLHVDYLSTEDLYDAYDACDVFLLPSEHESFGIVFCEAWSRKKPVIGNALCGPIASLITDGVDGFLCGTPEEMTARLELLLHSPSLARRLGENGYEKVKQNHTWEIVAGRFRRLYEEVCRGNGRP